ncbi:MAG TPA: hypothetical protein VF172_00185 [Nitrososphaera sp.]
MSQGRLFSFDASSFPLDPSVESYLKSKRAFSLDFGRFAYINSEMMSTILLELIEGSRAGAQSSAELIAQLKAEVGRYSAERQKMLEDTAKLVTQVKSYSAEAAALKEQVAEAAKMVEELKAENARLQSMAKKVPPPTAQSTPQASSAVADEKLRQSYEKLVKDFQLLKAQNAEALTSLKVLEDENEELMLELEKMRHQLDAASTKAG